MALTKRKSLNFFKLRHYLSPLYLDTHGEGEVSAFPVQPCCYDGHQLRTFWHSDYFASSQRHRPLVRYDQAALELLEAYQLVCDDPQIHLDMELRAGDVQLVSNHSVVHARTEYLDFKVPEQRRHLLRLWLSLPQDDSFSNRLRRLSHRLRIISGVLAARLNSGVKHV